MQNFNSLLILNGIHKKELINSNINNLMKKYNVKIDYTQTVLKW